MLVSGGTVKPPATAVSPSLENTDESNGRGPLDELAGDI